MKKVLVIVAIVVILTMLCGCLETGLLPEPESKLIYSQLVDNSVSISRRHIISLDSAGNISKIDKVLVKANSVASITCNIKDTTQTVAGWYKIIASKTIPSPNNPNADWVTFQFDTPVDLNSYTTYQIEFYADETEICIRNGMLPSGASIRCYMLYGWK